jgi:oligoendopeptidase F
VTETKIPLHSAVDPRYTWNRESVFETDAAWEAELEALAAALPNLHAYQGRLHEDPALLLTALQTRTRLQIRVHTAAFYAQMLRAVDAGNDQAAGMVGRAMALAGRTLATAAFFNPELLAIGRETLAAWALTEPGLAAYAHMFDDLFRRTAHIRSAEVEELLGALADPFEGISAAAGTLKDSEVKFTPAHTQTGQELEITHDSYHTLMSASDREARRTAWESYTDGLLAYRNTLSATLATSLKQNIFTTRARRFNSSLEMALFDLNLSEQVFHSLLATFRENLPTWHRYFELRRRALKVDKLAPYDIWAPLSTGRPAIPYLQAVEWICAGLAPLGADYTAAIRRGCLEQRWVDVYPSQGKFSGAFSYGVYGTYPFIVMSYSDSILSLSTLAHELGHSMHTYLTFQAQPAHYADYSLFVAEVASNFHQAVVRAHLLETNSDPAFQIAVIEEAMSNFYRYFLVMPTLARFELEMHSRAERGDSLASGEMIRILADLFGEAYGPAMAIDTQRVGISWAQFDHLFTDYYVFQYATGISAANALAKRVRSGGEKAAAEYRSFLSAGSSVYPLEALKLAGVDLSSPEPVQEAFRVLSGYVDLLEKLLG